MAVKISNELREQLGPELVEQLEAAAKDTDILLGVAANYITKERFDEVNTQLGDLKTTNAKLEKDIAAAVKSSKTQDELNAKIAELTEANQKAQQEYEAKIAERDRNYEIDKALSGAKPKNAKAVRGLLNLDEVEIKDGKIIGLDKQLEALKKSDPYLFEEAKEPTPKIDRFGIPISEGGGGGKTESEEVKSILGQMGFQQETEQK